VADGSTGLAALAVYAVVGSGSPGPNNALLWASGIRFGLRRTLPHVVGTAIGIGTLFVAVGAGIGAALTAAPWLEVVLKVVGSVYLLVIAFLVVGGGVIGRADVSRPLGVADAVRFQWVNPKGWLFAVTAVGAFVPDDLHRALGIALVVAIVACIVAATATGWAVGGAAIGRLLSGERARRVVNVALAVLLVLSVALLWV
jgi:threonine/homoserine/homoserine lactone efflux protein